MGWALIQRLASLREEGNLDTKNTRECHVKTEADIGERHLQAKGHQGLLVTTRGQDRGMTHVLPQNLQKEPIPPMPGF